MPYNIGWSVLGFTSVFLYQILNRYSKLFGTMIVPIIIIIIFVIIIIIITIIIYIYLIIICLTI